MFAVLVREPFFLTVDQFMELDDWTVMNVYFRPNANEESPEKGYRPVRRAQPEDIQSGDLQAIPIASYKDLFFDSWRKQGMAEADIEKRFWELNPDWKDV